MQPATVKTTQAAWAKLPSRQVGCINDALHQQGGSVEELIQRDVLPSDARLANERSNCQTQFERQDPQPIGSQTSAYAVSGVALGATVQFGSSEYREYKCGPSDQGVLFWFARSFKSLDGTLGLFTADRLGFNMAWLAAIYLTFQLISIPFALPSATSRFIGVAHGMASLVPLTVVLIVVFGKPHLIGTAPRWEAAFLLIFITMVDLFGGYTFNIALSRRTMDVTPVAPA